MSHRMAVHLAPGIHRFRPEHFRSSYAVFQQRARSNPGVLVITCSDPGADPFRLIPVRPVVRYVHQNFGNLVLPSKSGMRSDVDVLLELHSIMDIVVCGHAPCEVMRLVLSRHWHETAWLRHAARTRTIVFDNYRGASEDQLVGIASAENVLVQLENLCLNPTVARGLDSGSIHLHGWLCANRRISAYVPRTNRFVPLVQ